MPLANMLLSENGPAICRIPLTVFKQIVKFPNKFLQEEDFLDVQHELNAERRELPLRNDDGSYIWLPKYGLCRA